MTLAHALLLSSSSSARQLRSCRSQRRLVRIPLRRSSVVASAQEESKQQETPSVLKDLEQSASLMLQRYDFLSAGIGALAVTTVCVARGQDAYTALMITFASTVVALVLNEFVFEDSSRR